MKTIKQINFKSFFLLAILVVFASCERELSDEAEFATYSQNGDVFIDNFSAGLDYFPFVDAGADPTAFEVVTDDVYSGSAAIRFDVPTFGNGFVGATFNTTANRDLSAFDALTFYAKASQAASIDAIGFGINGDTGNKYQVTLNELEVTTAWKKYIIPIPDASKLTNETGLFWLAEGASFKGDEGGYVLWLDEIKFEKLGTVAQPQPAILNGATLSQEAFINVPITLTGLTQTYNLGNGKNQTVLASPSYFTFTSSNPGVASVNELGVVTVANKGETNITATLANVAAKGSLALNVTGPFDFAPNPPARATEDVVSVFSDAYTNPEIEYYNGFFTPDGQTTKGGFIDVSGNGVIRYTDLNFVALKTTNRVDASAMSRIHIDIKVEDAQIDDGDFVRVLLLAQNPDGTENQAFVNIPAADLKAGEWISFDRPLSDFLGVNLSNLSLFFFVSDATVASILVDNIYFYK